MSHESRDDEVTGNLLPCPCCGGEAQFDAITDDTASNFDGRYVHCIECELSTNLVFPNKGDVRRELTERWNKRTSALSERAPNMDALLKVMEAAREYTTERHYQNVEACRKDQDRLEGILIAAIHAADNSAALKQQSANTSRDEEER